MNERERKKEILFIYDTEWLCLKDIERYSGQNVTVMDYYVRISRSCFPVRCIRRLLCSNKVNSIVRIPLKNLWSTLNWFHWDENKEYVVFFYGWYNKFLEPGFLMSLKEKHHIEYGICLTEALGSPHSEVMRYYLDKIKFKYIFSFDPKDADKHNFTHFGEMYSKLDIDPHIDQEHDLFYVGKNEPGRLKIIEAIEDAASQNGINAELRIVGVDKEEQRKNTNIIYNQFLSYDKVLTEVAKCNCILETPHPAASAPTYRYYEAICYNKKLLTTHKAIVDAPFYNPEYMHVFEKPEEIDWAWVKERIPVDYHYDNRYSPCRLIDRIVGIVEGTEGQTNGEKEDH